MENKYFTPDIEDLCIGYECEYNFARAYTNDFDFVKIGYKDITPGKGGYTNELTHMIHLIDDGAAAIRVPYLTKEQIESEGWEYKSRGTDLWFERKEIFLREDGYHLENIKLQYGLHDYRLKISFVYVGDGEESTGAYLGECKDINTFRKLIKLLGI
jgi:hypothetical protein